MVGDVIFDSSDKEDWLYFKVANRLINLILDYSINFTKEENKEIDNKYRNLDGFEFLMHSDMNEIMHAIYCYAMTYNLNIDGDYWSYSIIRSSITKQEPLTFETEDETCNRIYNNLKLILDEYHKKYSLLNRLTNRILFKLKDILIGKNLFYPSFIGKYILKFSSVRSLINKCEYFKYINGRMCVI